MEHVIATCSEWLLAICFEIYILTFVMEFQYASCHAPKLTIDFDKVKQSHQTNPDDSAVTAVVADKCTLTSRTVNGCHTVSITLPIDFK